MDLQAAMLSVTKFVRALYCDFEIDLNSLNGVRDLNSCLERKISCPPRQVQGARAPVPVRGEGGPGSISKHNCALILEHICFEFVALCYVLVSC